jgi:hypothetical protein
VRKADNLSPSSGDVTEYGSLNLPEPCGPHRAVMGMLYLYILAYLVCGVSMDDRKLLVTKDSVGKKHDLALTAGTKCSIQTKVRDCLCKR